jgi:hypothetical protein
LLQECHFISGFQQPLLESAASINEAIEVNSEGSHPCGQAFALLMRMVFHALNNYEAYTFMVICIGVLHKKSSTDGKNTLLKPCRHRLRRGGFFVLQDDAKSSSASPSL